MANTQAGTHSDAGPGPSAGLFGSLKSIAATLIASGRTRLELLGNEIEEEKLRAIHMLLMALGLVFCLGVGVLLAVAFLAVMYWDSRLQVLGGFACLFVVLGGLFFCALRSAAQRPAPLFSASLSELEEDLRQLKAAIRNEPAKH